MYRTANECRQNLPIIAAIDDEIKNLLREINNKIEDALRIDKVEIYVDLPIHFNHLSCNFLKNKDIQQKIYYNIITELEEKNFNVKLRANNESAKLKISWEIVINHQEIQRMDDKLNSLRF